MFKDPEHTNHLVNESSPYLLQHLHNPVDWHPWGDEAIAKAKKEQKLLLISIGYSACHWCHVMESESFENKEIARIMNKHFVCIKVDREERPDIDQIYMTAVQLMTGSGGWPLNCFALSDGSPFYGGTYFKPNDWKQLLITIAESYQADPQKFVEYSADLRLGINKTGRIFKKNTLSHFNDQLLTDGYNSWKLHFDHEWGGSTRAPKFPVPSGLKYLLKHAYHFNEKTAREHIDLTLEKMALGGLYDHIGHGFARYSTDIYWKVPHFEKMLYDNAQLLQLYSLAYRYDKNDLYKEVVEGTVKFLREELLSPEGGLYSSIDADSEGKEGFFYTFTFQELSNILGGNYPHFFNYYNISQEGNWEEGRNILWTLERLKDYAQSNSIEVSQLYEELKEASKIVKDYRELREKPGLDDKILASWNGMAINGLVEAYHSLGDKAILDMILEIGKFSRVNFVQNDYSLKRNFKNGKVSIDAFLDDYAMIINAFIKIYQLTLNIEWLDQAKNILDYTIENFYDNSSGMFFFTGSTHKNLITKTMELDDNVIPSSNSVMAKNLYTLGVLYSKNEYLEMSKQMVSNISGELNRSLAYHGHWAEVYLWFCSPPKEVVIVGKNAKSVAGRLSHLVPHNYILAGSESESNLDLFKNRFKEGKDLIYVCENGVCQQPLEDINEVIELLQA